MIRIITAAAATVALVSFYAAGPSLAASCKEEAAKRKLAGAALTSFMGKCEREAQESCDAKAGSQKLAGAAKTSFTKKCLSEAVGN
ncbi:MAG: hypothetical protein IT536_01370 [Hyphomicrobiales bacterium]|nr:hypothetical protein [Hyphomicrobiales bacterium]